MTFRRTALALFGIAWAMSMGCAGDRPSPDPLPHLNDPQARLDYYRTHHVQKVLGQNVVVDGRLFDAKDPLNGLAYTDDDGRVVDYRPGNSVPTQIVKSWFIVPAAGAVGGAVGLVVGAFSEFSPTANPNNPGTFAAVGGGAGVLLGAAAAGILTLEMPHIMARKNLRKAEKYNRRLWQDLNFGLAPYKGGEALSVAARF